MTAKESLREAIDEMTDAEAEALLERIQPQRRQRIPWMRGRRDNAIVQRLLEDWWLENRDVPDEEVAEYDRMLANLEPVRFREWHPE